MKVAGYIEVIELDLDEADYCDGAKYPHPGLYWLPNAHGGSYALAHGSHPPYAVFTIAYPKDHLPIKDSITSNKNPFDPPIMPEPGSDPNFNPYNFSTYKTHEVISTETFLKALALSMNQNTNNQVIEEILK